MISLLLTVTTVYQLTVVAEVSTSFLFFPFQIKLITHLQENIVYFFIFLWLDFYEFNFIVKLCYQNFNYNYFISNEKLKS